MSKKAKEARERIPKQRFLWSQFKDSLSERNFKRTFRMSKNCFDSLYNRIISVVGDDEFKSENFLETFMYVEQPNLTNIDRKRIICGEVRLVKIMAGGSYLDVAALYCCGYTHAYEIFHDTIRNWINYDEIIKINGLNYFENNKEMKKTRRDFQQTGCHGGMISDCVGAFDGWLVKIRRARSNNLAGHIASFHNRKGFYAVNVQAIVKNDEEILWRYIMCRGSEHDSTALKKTQLHEKLLSGFTDLLNHGLYIVGDSAYTIHSFLLVPIYNARPKIDENSFKYHHSTCRIWVECAFGDMIYYGIFFGDHFN